MNDKKIFSGLLATALTLTSVGTPWAHPGHEHDQNPFNVLLEDAGNAAKFFGALPGDVMAVRDQVTGIIGGFIVEKAGEFVTWTVEKNPAVGRIGPDIVRVGETFVDLTGAVVALNQDIAKAQNTAGLQLLQGAVDYKLNELRELKDNVSEGLIITGRGLQYVGEVISDGSDEPIAERKPGCDGPLASDGESLACQSPETIAAFTATFKGDAAVRWAWERTRDNVEGETWRDSEYGEGWNGQKSAARKPGCVGPLATDGESLACQHPDTIIAFSSAYGSNAAQIWANERSQDRSSPGWRGGGR